MKEEFSLRRLSYFMLSFAVLILVLGCGGSNDTSQSHDGLISEGIIYYDVTYPDLDPDGALVMMLPESLKVIFKKDKLKTSFKTAAGILRMDVISDASDYSMINTIQIFGDQYAVKIDSSADFRLGESLKGFEVETTDETGELAGNEVIKVNLKYSSDVGVKPVYVSNNFEVMDPNWATVYSAIEGMLMEYEIEHYDILMHLKATEVKTEKVDESEFEVEEGCTFLSEEEFDAFVRDNLKILLEDL